MPPKYDDKDDYVRFSGPRSPVMVFTYTMTLPENLGAMFLVDHKGRYLWTLLQKATRLLPIRSPRLFYQTCAVKAMV
jgi:hypothetical protein